jgi:hypothetical protein
LGAAVTLSPGPRRGGAKIFSVSMSRLAMAGIAAVATIVGGAASRAQSPGDVQSVHFTATPSSGSAPLTVKFCASAGISIDFGDGTGSGMRGASSGDCPSGLGWYTLHTYAAPGTYRLRGFPCPSSRLHPECGLSATAASQVTITVTRAP